MPIDIDPKIEITCGERSGQTGARRDSEGRIWWFAGQSWAIEGANQNDWWADRCSGVQAVRADWRGDQDCGRCI